VLCSWCLVGILCRVYFGISRCRLLLVRVDEWFFWCSV